MAAQVVTLDKAATALGQEVDIGVADGEARLNVKVKVTITDTPAKNGVINAIDAVPLPPQG